VTPGAEEGRKRIAQRADRARIEARAPERDYVYYAQRMGEVGDAEGRNIAAGPAHPAHHRKSPDPDELMHDAVAGHQRAVADLDPSGEQRAARDDGSIADPAVVRNVRVLHQEVVVAEDRDFAAFAAAMDRHALAKDVAITDPHATRAAAIGQVLRFVADNRGGMEHVGLADFDFAEDRDVAD